MHHSKDHFAAHILSTPFQITRWKAFHWSCSTKCAQILLLIFCTAIFYDLNSFWHQILWLCKLLVKLITGLKAQNSSAWRWRSLGSNCGQKLHQRHICDERDFAFWENLSDFVLREILHWERFSDLKVKVFRIKVWGASYINATYALRETWGLDSFTDNASIFLSTSYRIFKQVAVWFLFLKTSYLAWL